MTFSQKLYDDYELYVLSENFYRQNALYKYVILA